MQISFLAIPDVDPDCCDFVIVCIAFALTVTAAACLATVTGGQQKTRPVVTGRVFERKGVTYAVQ